MHVNSNMKKHSHNLCFILGIVCLTLVSSWIFFLGQKTYFTDSEIWGISISQHFQRSENLQPTFLQKPLFHGLIQLWSDVESETKSQIMAQPPAAEIFLSMRLLFSFLAVGTLLQFLILGKNLTGKWGWGIFLAVLVSSQSFFLDQIVTVRSDNLSFFFFMWGLVLISTVAFRRSFAEFGEEFLESKDSLKKFLSQIFLAKQFWILLLLGFGVLLSTLKGVYFLGLLLLSGLFFMRASCRVFWILTYLLSLLGVFVLAILVLWILKGWGFSEILYSYTQAYQYFLESFNADTIRKSGQAWFQYGTPITFVTQFYRENWIWGSLFGLGIFRLFLISKENRSPIYPWFFLAVTAHSILWLHNDRLPFFINVFAILWSPFLLLTIRGVLAELYSWKAQNLFGLRFARATSLMRQGVMAIFILVIASGFYLTLNRSRLLWAQIAKAGTFSSSPQMEFIDYYQRYLNVYPWARTYDVIGLLPHRAQLHSFLGPGMSRENPKYFQAIVDYNPHFILKVDKLNYIRSLAMPFLEKQYYEIVSGLYVRSLKFSNEDFRALREKESKPKCGWMEAEFLADQVLRAFGLDSEPENSRLYYYVEEGETRPLLQSENKNPVVWQPGLGLDVIDLKVGIYGKNLVICFPIQEKFKYSFTLFREPLPKWSVDTEALFRYKIPAH